MTAAQSEARLRQLATDRPTCPHCGEPGRHATDWDCLRAVRYTLATARPARSYGPTDVCVRGHLRVEHMVGQPGKPGCRACKVSRIGA